MRHRLNDQWDFVTVMVLVVFFITVIVYGEPTAFIAAAVTFVIFRPRRRRLIRPGRIARNVMTRKIRPAKMKPYRPRMAR